MELPIKQLLLGHPLEKVAHGDAMANPASLVVHRVCAAARAQRATSANLNQVSRANEPSRPDSPVHRFAAAGLS